MTGIDVSSTPSVSVVLVTYDRGTDVLSRSLNSVLCQTSLPCEIFIVDGGSRGHRSRTCSFVDAADAHGVPLKVVGDHDMSAPQARNLGASLCHGDYVAFLDDDDEWYPGKLSSQIGSSNGAAIVCSPYDEEFRDTWRVFTPQNEGYPSILGRNNIGSTSFPLVRRDVLLDVGGFDESFESNQEWDLWMRILRNHDCALCDAPAGKKYDSAGITFDRRRRLNGWRSVFRKHRAEYREHPEIHRNVSRTFYNDMASRSYYYGALCARIEMLR